MIEQRWLGDGVTEVVVLSGQVRGMCCSFVLASHASACIMALSIWWQVAIPLCEASAQGTSQVLRLRTRFPYEVLSIGTKPEEPCFSIK
jgi:hypothetical protein